MVEKPHNGAKAKRRKSLVAAPGAESGRKAIPQRARQVPAKMARRGNQATREVFIIEAFPRAKKESVGSGIRCGKC